MASTYTLNNGIQLMGTGDQSGLWGDTTNVNLQLIDTALDGQITVTLSSNGTTGTPNDLPRLQLFTLMVRVQGQLPPTFLTTRKLMLLT